MLHDKLGTKADKDTGFGDELREFNELSRSSERGVNESLRRPKSSSLEDSVSELLLDKPIAFG